LENLKKKNRKKNGSSTSFFFLNNKNFPVRVTLALINYLPPCGREAAAAAALVSVSH
jgi:hypothetical protein